ncbi:unnamed protein product [Clonostachys rhizophaga]|uniref:2-dehydropantoate 2-reductase n=1 Tax=Clonostachys rhizophaga TaxID=160324 RepID=A0A9N9VJG5_9HYPO|nr:unnamed protein product [Clonostachys rhizophaga]
MSSALVYGGGCIGAVSAYLLSQKLSPERIALICRSNYKEIKENGITINSGLWGSQLNVRPAVYQSVDAAVAEQGFAYDYVFITTKAQSKEDTDTEAVASAISSTTAIVLMQNGVGIEDPWHTRFPDNPVISVVMYLPVTQTQPGVFSHALYHVFQIGTFPHNAPERHQSMAKNLSAILSLSGAKAAVFDDVQPCRWRKMLVNGSENPICALVQLPDVAFFQSSPGATQFTRDVMIEIASVARAAGYPAITDQVVQEQLDVMTGRPFPGVEPSMMADAMAGRQMEADAIIGNVVRIGSQYGVETPRLSTLYYLIQGLNYRHKRGVPVRG